MMPDRTQCAVVVRCLSCRQRAVLTERELVRFVVKEAAPIAQFVKRLKCRKCGSASVMARRSHSKTAARTSLLRMTDPDLIRFLDAQDQLFGQVTDELTNGRKQTHWMWFVFPQLAGLGQSAMAHHYAITDLDQAKRYLADSILGARLRQVVKIMAGHHDKSAYDILSSPDDLKFRSCLTLLREAASDPSDRALFTQALDQFYQGQADATTLALLQ